MRMGNQTTLGEEFYDLVFKHVSRLDEKDAVCIDAYCGEDLEDPWWTLDGMNAWHFCGNFMEIGGVVIVQWASEAWQDYEFYATFARGALDLPLLVSFIRRGV